MRAENKVTNFRDSSSLSLYYRFGFEGDNDNVLEFHAEHTYRNNATLVITMNPLELYLSDKEDYCPTVPDQDDHFMVIDFEGVVDVETTVSDRGMYYFIFLRCDTEPWGVEVSYVFLNSGGNELSLEYMPLPYIILVLFLSWSIMLAVWVYNYYLHRQKAKFHMVISICLLLAIVNYLFSLVFWFSIKSSGTYSTVADVFGTLFNLFATCGMLAILLLVAIGWGILRDDNKRLGKISLALGTYLVAELLTFQNVSWTIISMFAIVLMFFMTLVYTKKCIAKLIKIQMKNDQEKGRGSDNNADNDSNIREPPLSINIKLKMYNVFYVSMMAYLCSIFLLTLLQFILDYTYYWVYYLLRRLLDIAMYSLVCYTFRQRHNTRGFYYQLSDMTGNYDDHHHQHQPSAPQNIEVIPQSSQIGTIATLPPNV